MNIDLKVAVVTGGTSGIGLAVSKLLHQNGAKVVLSGLDDQNGEVALDAIGASPETAVFIPADVTNETQVQRLMDRAKSLFGGIDILINNAGILGGPRFPEGDRDHWLRAIAVNQIGTLNCIQAALLHMRPRGAGVIVNTSSTSGLTPNLIDPVYAMTKAGIVNLTRSLAFLKSESNIRVNCVCPALVKTTLEANSARFYDESSRQAFLSGRAGRIDNPALEPDDVAKAIIKLVIDETLNGVAYKIVFGERDELVYPAAPQKL
ncbi:SDR family oxidoreductase [Alcaligenaceae bacterium]|nr:SDR family oxidoreductase [Alcaligenaceae bacterium]